jgi:phosphoribosylformylglycinamidine cyclo-ligase
VRKIVTDHDDLARDFHGQPLALALMAPTRIYVKSILALLSELPVKGLAHITGGGLLENVPRVLPAGLCAVMQRAHWTMPPVFSWLQQTGNVAEHEMYRTFNCGIGMVAIVAAEHAGAALDTLRSKGETAWLIGAVRVGDASEAQAIVE